MPLLTCLGPESIKYYRHLLSRTSHMHSNFQPEHIVEGIVPIEYQACIFEAMAAYVIGLEEL